jgi:hypothetical protein
MFRAFASLTLASAALLAFAAPADAQVTNRGIRDIRIVHPPGTPPGTWRVVAEVECTADSAVPRPADFSYDLQIHVNGLLVDSVSTPMSLQAPVVTCGPCVGEGCGFWFGPYNTTGKCHVAIFGSGLTLCGCVGRWHDFGGNPHTSALRSSDTVTVTITPSASAVADMEPSDDSMTLPVGALDVGATICAGDGTLPTACPCANTGAAGHGCANSANPEGALLGATGWTGADPDTGTDSVTLHGSGMPATSTAIYLKGDGLDPAGAPFGDGVLCVSGSLIRLRTKINVGGASMFPEPGDPSLSVRGATPPGSGLVARYQVYYRNAAAAFCPPATFNVSNGVELEW